MTDSRRSQRTVLAVLAFAVLAFSVGQTAFIPAIGPLAAALDTSTTAATWAVTASLVSAAVLTPVAGRLSDMFGERVVLLAVLACTAAGGMLSALGDDLGLIVLGRVLYGAGGGVFPTSFGIVRESFSTRSRAGSVGLLTAISGLGAGLGPAIGGFLVDVGSYAWVFWSGAALAIAALLVALPLVPETQHRATARVDWLGMTVLAAAVTAPLIAISKANIWGWTSARTLGLAGLGLVLLPCFVVLEQRVTPPLIDIGTLRRPVVAITNLAAMLIGFGMYSACLLIPQYAQTPTRSGYGLGLGAGGAGLLLAPGCTFMVVTGMLSGRLSSLLGTRLMLALGAFATSLGLALLALEHSTEQAVVLGSVVLFGGIVGAAVGAQVSVAIIASSAQSGGFATEGAYVAAFLAAAAVTALGALAALAIPVRRRRIQSVGVFD